MLSKTLKLTLVAASCSLLSNIASAQVAPPPPAAIVVDPLEDAVILSNQLIIPDTGITITSANLTLGIPGEVFNCEICAIPGPQSGTFLNPGGDLGLPLSGVVLSTGNVTHSVTNDYGRWGSNFSLSATAEQNQRLNQITGAEEHFDPVELSISFTVADDVETVSILAGFGSNEWLGEGSGDGFGMFYNGVNVAGTPDEEIPGELEAITDYNSNMTNSPVPFGPANILSQDGEPLMRFDVPVDSNSDLHTLSFIIADSWSGEFDSAVLLSNMVGLNAAGELAGSEPDAGTPDQEVRDGTTELLALLPDPTNPIGPNGEFNIVVPDDLEAGQTIWFDPEIAVGYTYQTDGMFASVSAPSLTAVNDLDGYMLSYFDGVNLVEIALAAGESHMFSTPVSEFKISGINPELALDPTDQLAFVTGVSFAAGNVGTWITQTPDTIEVPEPVTFGLFSLGLLGLGASVRRKNKLNA